MSDSSHVINQAAIDAAATIFRTEAPELFMSSSDPATVNALASIRPADGGPTTTLVFEDYLSTWEEFLGARTTGVSRAYSVSVALSTWTMQMKVRRLEAMNDRNGFIAQRVRNFLSSATSYKDYVIHQALVSNSGLGPVGYDAVNLLSTAHPNGPSGNQSNTGTTALSQTSFNTGFAAMTSLQRENGEPYNIVPRYLMVGPKNHMIGKQITKADIRGQAVDAAGLESGTRVGTAGVSNVYNGVVELIVNPRLVDTYDDYWYILGSDRSGSAKPLILIEAMGATEQLDTDLNSPTVMQSNALTFGLAADAQISAGLWQCIYGGIL